MSNTNTNTNVLQAVRNITLLYGIGCMLRDGGRSTNATNAMHAAAKAGDADRLISAATHMLTNRFVGIAPDHPAVERLSSAFNLSFSDKKQTTAERTAEYKQLRGDLLQVLDSLKFPTKDQVNSAMFPKAAQMLRHYWDDAYRIRSGELPKYPEVTFLEMSKLFVADDFKAANPKTIVDPLERMGTFDLMKALEEVLRTCINQQAKLKRNVTSNGTLAKYDLLDAHLTQVKVKGRKAWNGWQFQLYLPSTGQTEVLQDESLAALVRTVSERLAADYSAESQAKHEAERTAARNKQVYDGIVALAAATKLSVGNLLAIAATLPFSSEK